MESPVTTYTADPCELDIDKCEVLRYLGYDMGCVTENDKELISPLIEDAVRVIIPKACYRRFDISLMDDFIILLPYGEIVSRHLSLNLKGCKSIYMLAATIGAQYDRMMMRERVTSMARAAIFQAIGATAVEAFVERMCVYLKNELENTGESMHPRFSPGYGDFDLSNQMGVFKVLSPEKYAGITLNDSLVMSPEKSVTAIIGIEKL